MKIFTLTAAMTDNQLSSKNIFDISLKRYDFLMSFSRLDNKFKGRILEQMSNIRKSTSLAANIYLASGQDTHLGLPFQIRLISIKIVMLPIIPLVYVKRYFSSYKKNRWRSSY